jgi:hypothetical protein
MEQWHSVYIRGEARQVTFKFGHDFAPRELWIVDVTSGRRIARIAPDLSPRDAERVGRLVRQVPVLHDVCCQAVGRLARARHPNAVALRELILGALAGMELPCSDESSDRIDP